MIKLYRINTILIKKYLFKKNNCLSLSACSAADGRKNGKYTIFTYRNAVDGMDMEMP